MAGKLCIAKKYWYRSMTMGIFDWVYQKIGFNEQNTIDDYFRNEFRNDYGNNHFGRIVLSRESNRIKQSYIGGSQYV